MTIEQVVPTPAATAETRSATVARNVRLLRKTRGWTAQRLADEMAAVGVRWERMVVTKLETGRRAAVTLDEAYALAFIFGTTVEQLATATACDTCHGCPPPGFACNTCGAGGTNGAAP